MRSLCQQKGKGSLSHNNREFVSENVDKDRSNNNVIIKQQSLQDAYKECYGAAVAEYNAKQKRADRKIDNYFKQLFGVSATDNSAENVLEAKEKPKSFYEDVVQVGDLNDTGCKRVIHLIT